MKKLMAILFTGLLVFGLSNFAGATAFNDCQDGLCPPGTEFTWVDTIDFDPDQEIDWWESYHYTHDLTDNAPPFVPFEDFSFSYNLNLSLYDDGGRRDSSEIAFVSQPGLLGDGYYNFDYSNNDFGWSLIGLAEVNLAGVLDVTIKSHWGDFLLASSTLTVEGCNNNPVPEPGTVILLGSGLLGMVVYGRKRKFFKK